MPYCSPQGSIQAEGQWAAVTAAALPPTSALPSPAPAGLLPADLREHCDEEVWCDGGFQQRLPAVSSLVQVLGGMSNHLGSPKSP